MSNHDVTMLDALKDNEWEVRARTNNAKVSIRKMSMGFFPSLPFLLHMYVAMRLRAKCTYLIFLPSSDIRSLFGRLNQEEIVNNNKMGLINQLTNSENTEERRVASKKKKK